MTIKDKLKQEIEGLSDETVKEAYYFIKFIEIEKEKEKLTKFAQKISEQSFLRVWDNREDSAYDRL